MASLQKICRYVSQSEFLRYFWAGCLTFLVDFLILLLLTEYFGINYLWSNVAGVCAGIVIGYQLCVKWVFQNRRYTSVVQEFPLFVLTCIIGILLNEFLLWTCVEFGNINYLVAKIIVTAAVFIFNFCLRRKVLFHR